MLKAYRYRLYPTNEQRQYFAQSFGNVRKVYNLALDMRCILYNGCGASVGRKETQAQLVAWKEMYPYLELSNSQSLQYAVKQVDDAFQNWWKGSTGHPLPKRRSYYNSFHNPQHCCIDWKHGLLTIPKCKDIPIVLHRSFHGTIKDVTVSMRSDGSHYASILVDTAVSEKPCKPVEADSTIGLDAGVSTFIVSSDGRVFPSLHFARKEARRLKHYQRELRLKKKGSKNREETLRHIAKIQGRVANQRLDYIHKITYELTHDSQVRTICIEDLNVREMMRNHHLAYSIADAGMGMFFDILEYKCRWYGINLIRIDRWDASSRTCSVCGGVNHFLKLGDREWTCVCCGSHHNRDFNASVNIKNFGLRQTLPVDGREVTPVDCPPVDDRRLADLRSSGSMMQEKFRGVTDAPVL